MNQHLHNSGVGYHTTRIVDRSIKLLALLSSIALGVMVLIIVTNVLMRYLINKPVNGSIELVELLTVVVVFCTMAYTQMENAHVTVDVLTTIIPPKVERALSRAMNFLGGVFFFFLGWQGCIMGKEDIIPIIRSTAILSIPMAPFKYALAAGALIAGIKMFIDCFPKNKGDK